jgi:hypothetical protein
VSEAKRDAVKRVLEAATLEEVLPNAANSMTVAFRMLSLQAGLVFILKEQSLRFSTMLGIRIRGSVPLERIRIRLVLFSSMTFKVFTVFYLITF